MAVMNLLRDVLQTICDAAEQSLQNVERRPDSWLTLTSLVDHDGSLNESARDKVVMTVYNLKRETFASSYTPSPRASAGAGSANGLPVLGPTLYLDIHLMFMANFTERSYPDGLAALSRLIGYFQQMPVMNAKTLPGLSQSVDQLSLEMENLSPIDVNYVMSMLGTRYLPSAFYKLRMVPFPSTAMTGRTYPVEGPAMAPPSARTPP